MLSHTCNLSFWCIDCHDVNDKSVLKLFEKTQVNVMFT